MNKVSIPKLHSYKLKHMDNVHMLNVDTTEPLDPKRVIVGAMDYDLAKVIICGVLSDGEGYFSSSEANVAEITYMLQRMLNALSQS